MKRAFKVLLLSASLLVFAACTSEGVNQTNNGAAERSAHTDAQPKKQGQAFIKNDQSQPNILQIAMGSPDHTTLVAAVEAAELENALVNAGPLMVFAPVNEAFDALPDGTVETLLKHENKDQLAFILKNHVTPGNYSKDFFKEIQEARPSQ